MVLMIPLFLYLFIYKVISNIKKKEKKQQMALCENQVDINLHNNGNETVMENNSGNNNTLFDIIPTKHEGVYKIISSSFNILPILLKIQNPIICSI